MTRVPREAWEHILGELHQVEKIIGRSRYKITRQEALHFLTCTQLITRQETVVII